MPQALLALGSLPHLLSSVAEGQGCCCRGCCRQQTIISAWVWLLLLHSSFKSQKPDETELQALVCRHYFSPFMGPNTLKAHNWTEYQHGRV